jgi:hypothetical protein
VVDGFTTVFYVNSAGFLLQLANEYEDDGEIVQTSETYRENYNDDPVKAGKEGAAKKDTKDVKSETKDIAAISYKLPSDPADGPSRVCLQNHDAETLIANTARLGSHLLHQPRRVSTCVIHQLFNLFSTVSQTGLLPSESVHVLQNVQTLVLDIP